MPEQPALNSSAAPAFGRLVAWLAGAALGVVALVAVRPLGPFADSWLLSMGAAAALFTLLARWEALGGRGRDVACGALISAAGLIGLRVARYAWGQAVDPPMWDFDAFWVAARVAVSGRNYYDPAALHALAAPVHKDAEFVAEILNVGYWYPPPSILLIAPFGLLDRAAAGMLWIASVSAALAASILLLWRAFLRGLGVAGLAVAALLLFVEHGTRLTFYRSQTNFLLLFLALLLWHRRGRRLEGAWLALAFMTKPVAAALAADLMARRRWAALGLALGVLVAATAAAAIAFGPGPIVTYLTTNPMRRLPDYVFVQAVNQSAPGFVMRMLGGVHGAAREIALGVSALLVGVTLLRVFDRRVDPGLRYGLLVAGGLLVYPGTLGHYSVLLVLPIMLLWERRREVPGGAPFVIGVAAAAYGLMAGFLGGVLAAITLVWIALVVASAPTGRKRAHAEPHPASGAGAGAR